jgi:O-antigen ligase
VFALLIGGEGVERAIGTIGEPNALAAVVLFVWPFLYFTKRPIPQWVKLASLALVFLLIYITGSRSGMIAFIIQLTFILISRTQLSLAKGVVISFLILIVTYSLPFMPQGSIYEQRSEIWHAAVVAGAEKPIIGHGFGNTQVALEASVNKLNNNLRGSYVDSSHNIFLDWWVQGGFIGLGLFIVLLYKIFRQFIRKEKVMELVLLLGLLAALSFNPASVVSLVALWWLMGQALQ